MPTTPIVLNDLTTGTIGGAGVFDSLMTTMTAHLDDQWAKNRIQSSDYANVYAQLLPAMLQQGVQFLLSKDEAASKAALVEAQVALAEAQKLKIDAEIAKLQLEQSKTAAEVLVLEKNACILTIQCANEQAKSDAEVGLAVAKRTSEEKNACIMTIKCAKEAALLDGDILLKTRQQDLIYKQTLTEVERLDMLTEQQAKVGSEKLLLDQKLFTELKQGTVLDAQTALYNKQKDGFDRDAEQKAAKMWSDQYSVQRTTDDTLPPHGFGFDPSNTHLVMTKLAAGIGVALATNTP